MHHATAHAHTHLACMLLVLAVERLRKCVEDQCPRGQTTGSDYIEGQGCKECSRKAVLVLLVLGGKRKQAHLTVKICAASVHAHEVPLCWDFIILLCSKAVYIQASKCTDIIHCPKKIDCTLC